MLSLRFKHINLKYAYFVSLCFLAFGAKAKEGMFTVAYKDSLILSNNELVLYNNIDITNNTSKSLLLQLTLKLPQGLKNIGSNDQEISLAPGSSTQIPFNIIFARSVPSNWQDVAITVSDKSTNSSKTYIYHTKVSEKYSFKVQNVTEDFYLNGKPETLKLGVYLKNTGNVTDVYSLRYANSAFGIDNEARIVLPAGKDTIYYYKARITKHAIKNTNTEQINLRVQNSIRENSNSIVYNVTNPRDEISMNPSAYSFIPLTINLGGFVFGNQFSFYGGAMTSFSVGAHKFSGSYISKRFSNNNFLNNTQPNFYLFTYQYKKMYLKAGTFNEAYNFLSFGNSLSLGYKDEDKSFVITGTLKNRFYVNTQSGNNISAVARYKLGNIKIEHIAEANFDTTRRLNGYVLDNKANLIQNKTTNLRVKLGASLMEKTRNIPGVQKHTPGMSAGYDFSHSFGTYSLSSGIEFYDKNFAGFKTGMFVQTHSVSKNFNQHWQLTALYNRNRMVQNYFRDSLYNTDIFTYNNSKYGIQVLRTDRSTTVLLGGGIIQQPTLIVNQNATNRSAYGELVVNHKFNKNTSLALNSFNGFNYLLINKLSWICNQNMNFMAKYYGLSAFYVRTLFISEGSGYAETVFASPYVKYSFNNNQGTALLSLNAAKNLNDEIIRTGVGVAFSYNNLKTRTRVNLNGNMPFKNYTNKKIAAQEMQYANLSVSQDIHIPIKRKYYDLKVVLYNDKNNNQQRDVDEELLKNVPVNIDDNTMISNEKGEVRYRNLAGGQYSVGVYRAYADEGLIPSNGPDFAVNLAKKNETISMPFKKGKVVSGHVKIVQDAINSNQLSSQFIRIVATDSLERKYTTLTDEEGNFFLYVPEGEYQVALNTAVYGNNIKAVTSSYNVNLAQNENALVCFELKQKKREVRFLNQNLTNNEDKKPKETAATVKPAATIPPPPPKVEAPKPAPQPLAKIDMKPIGAIANTLATTAAPLAGIAIATTPVEQILARAEHMDPLEALGKPLAVTLDKPEAAAATLAVVEEQPVKAEKGQWAPRRSVIRN